MKSIIIFVLICFVLLLNGCEITPKEYYLEDIELKDNNLVLQKKETKSTEIYFNIVNNAEDTLVSKIEIEANESCFQSNQGMEMPQILPGSKRISMPLRLKYFYKEEERKQCGNNNFEIKIILKDINTEKIFDEKIVIIKLI